MNKFSVQKVIFAGSFLAILGALYPLMQKLEGIGFIFLGYNLSVMGAYYTLVVLLFTSIFFYAFNYITAKPVSLFSIMGNFIYATAILTPAIFIFLYIIQLLFSTVDRVLSTEGINVGSVATAATSLLSVSTLIASFYSSLGRRDKLSALNYFENQKIEELEKALILLKQKNYQEAFFSIIEGLKNSLEKILLLKGASLTGGNLEDIVRAVADLGGLSTNTFEHLKKISKEEEEIRLYNKKVNGDQVEKYLDQTYSIIADIDRATVKHKYDRFEDRTKYRFDILITTLILAFGFILFNLFKVMFLR